MNWLADELARETGPHVDLAPSLKVYMSMRDVEIVRASWMRDIEMVVPVSLVHPENATFTKWLRRISDIAETLWRQDMNTDMHVEREDFQCVLHIVGEDEGHKYSGAVWDLGLVEYQSMFILNTQFLDEASQVEVHFTRVHTSGALQGIAGGVRS
jgi:hypothetical protein